MENKIKELFIRLKEKNIVINNITNPISANACANIQLAIGVKPMMSSCIYEIDDVLDICKGININIGQASENLENLLLELINKLNKFNKKVVLDPVGVSAFKYRFNLVEKLLSKIKFTVIKGNISEIKTIKQIIFNNDENKKQEFIANKFGIDVDVKDADMSAEELIVLAKEVSKKLNSIIIITGKVDIVADSKKAYAIYNGNELMSKTTATGCCLSALITAFVSATKNDILFASFLAVASIGICGEIAYENMLANEANGSYMNKIIDAVYKLDEKIIIDRLKYKEY